jgi:O-Antigen ligase
MLAGGATLATAGLTYAVDRHQGAYGAGTWGPLGAGAALAVFALVCLGGRPGRTVLTAAGWLLGLGALGVASVAWGGIGQQAWRAFDLALVGGLALVAGSLAFGARPRLAVAAVATGVAALAAEVLVRVAVAAPPSWFHGRVLDGPVGYHNAQGVLFAVGVALALGELDAREPLVRALAGASAVICLAGTLLTQSRGALLALGASAIVYLLASGRLSLAVRTALATAAGLLLVRQLAHVDLALLDTHAVTGSLDAYAELAGGAALAVAALAAVPLPTARLAVRRRLPVAILLVCAGLATIAAVVPAGRIASLSRELRSDVPPDTAAGSTRFTSLSLNGRRDAWRVALDTIRAKPLLGGGSGSFARAWTRDRHLMDLYVRQPHNIFLEVTSELGVAGLVLWVGFLAWTFAAIRRGRSPAGASAALALATLLLEASVDWTWSFPGIVAPVLLVVGASAGPPRWRRPPRPAVAAFAAAALAAAAAFSLPWAGARQLQAATAIQTTQPAQASSLARSARSLTPTDPAPIALLGRLAESERRYTLAATLYAEAASRSQEPWVLEWERARVLLLDRHRSAAAAACRLAIGENPGEPVIRDGPCAGVT